VDISLEGNRGISEPKRYNDIFEIAVTGAEGCLLFVSSLNADSVISIFDVELRKVPGP